jgi:hypothetical protein
MVEVQPDPPSASSSQLAWVRALLVTSLVLLGGPAVWLTIAEEPAGPVLGLAALPYALVLLALKGRSVVVALGAARILAVGAVVFGVLAIGIPSLL